eukprot:1884506-Prymnesium_polylepis.1
MDTDKSMYCGKLMGVGGLQMAAVLPATPPRACAATAGSKQRVRRRRRALPRRWVPERQNALTPANVSGRGPSQLRTGSAANNDRAARRHALRTRPHLLPLK